MFSTTSANMIPLTTDPAILGPTARNLLRNKQHLWERVLATLSISSPLSSWVSLTLARLRSALSNLDSHFRPLFSTLNKTKPSPANICDAKAQNPAESERKLFKFRNYILSSYTLCPWCNRWQSWRHYWGQVQSAGGQSEWTSSWWESLIKGILPSHKQISVAYTSYFG